MSSKSKAQHNFMEMIAHDAKAAHRVGVPQGVGKDFVAADTGKKMSRLPMKVTSSKSTKATHGYGR
jgi:hypothetical protein